MKGKAIPMISGSYMDAGQQGVPTGTSNTMSAALYSWRNHSGFIKRGQTKTCSESWRLIRAFLSSSIATEAAAGGGFQMKVPRFVA
jgi:hypothetical protein